MTIKIEEKLPNPDESDPQGVIFNKYINNQSIKTCTEPAVVHYQNAAGEGFFDAHYLNHYLTLKAHGKSSDYALLAEDTLDIDPEDSEYKKSLQAMESIFNNGAYSFSADSIVYKGVRLSLPYYKILSLQERNVGETITFPGYLSTTVSINKAKDFTSEHDLLLIISGLENASCIVPENKVVLNTRNSLTSEQEIILKKNTTIEITHVDKDKLPKEFKCRVISQEKQQ